MAYEMANPSDQQDAAQEGRIAAWRALEAHPGHSYGYYRTCVKNAIRGFLKDGRITGKPPHQGWQEADWHPSKDAVVMAYSPVHRDSHSWNRESVPERFASLHRAINSLPDRDREWLIDQFWNRGKPLAGAHRPKFHERIKPQLLAVLDAA